MIFLNDGTQPRRTLEAGPHAAEAARHALWIDLRDPTDAERGVVEQATGLRLPSQAELSEIENSSRLAHHDGVFTLSTPMSARVEQGAPLIAPLGFVLTKDRLLTVRYADLRAFDIFAQRFCDTDAPHTGLGAFVGLLEALVDRLADVLEHVGAELDRNSRTVFRPDMATAAGDRRADRELHAVLSSIGRNGEVVSNLRDSLLGIGRILGYVAEIGADRIPNDMQVRFKTLRADMLSLNDYDSQLSNKVQFLLDATLGFINLQQNNIIKILTVASIVGIPPTLIAGIYGMNFTNIPELKWSFGYPYSLVLMALSAILPLVWFRRRGWL